MSGPDCTFNGGFVLLSVPLAPARRCLSVRGGSSLHGVFVQDWILSFIVRVFKGRNKALSYTSHTFLQDVPKSLPIL